VIWAPLIGFLLLFALVALGLLRPADRNIRSRLIGKPMPALVLPAMVHGHAGLSDATPGPRLVNIFASWCGPCAAEAGALGQLKRRGVAIDGVAVRDTPADLAAFLVANGDPYRAIGNDAESRSMIALGSSGVPESFIVDARGIIRYQHIGAIGPQDVEDIAREYQAVGR